MKRFKNILVVITDNKDSKNNPALKRGWELAKKNNGCLTLMDVISPSKSVITEYKGIFKPEELVMMIVSRREQALEKIAKRLITEKGTKVDTEVDINIKVAVGRDFIEIVRQVVSENHDLLIKEANVHSDSFDSTDFHLMRKCPQPVWLIKAENQIKRRNILATVDLSLEKDEEGQALNTLIMDLATSLARWENSELHVLSCWSLYGESSLRNSSFMKVSEAQVEKLIEIEEQSNQELLSALVKRYAHFEIQKHLIKGDPVDHIPAFVKENSVDAVVMGTVARSGIPGLLIGNTSETILQLIDTSVITVKPRGFKSII